MSIDIKCKVINVAEKDYMVLDKSSGLRKSKHGIDVVCLTNEGSVVSLTLNDGANLAGIEKGVNVLLKIRQYEEKQSLGMAYGEVVKV